MLYGIINVGGTNMTMKYIFKYDPANEEEPGGRSTSDASTEAWAKHIIATCKKMTSATTIVNSALVLLWLKVLVKEKHLNWKEVGIQLGDKTYPLTRDGLIEGIADYESPGLDALRRLNGKTPR